MKWLNHFHFHIAHTPQLTMGLKILMMILSLLLIGSILVQQRGSGLGGAFGGEGAVYRTRRGAEQFLFRSTIVLGILFVLTAILTIVI